MHERHMFSKDQIGVLNLYLSVGAIQGIRRAGTTLVAAKQLDRKYIGVEIYLKM